MSLYVLTCPTCIEKRIRKTEKGNRYKELRSRFILYYNIPAPNLSTAYIFASGDNFFAYPNNYNYYVSYYRDTFQHGGISMEEMLIPLITLQSKKRN